MSLVEHRIEDKAVEVVPKVVRDRIAKRAQIQVVEHLVESMREYLAQLKKEFDDVAEEG